MIRINALAFLFVIQFQLIFLCVAIVLFLKYRKLAVKEIISRGEINRLRSEAAHQEIENIEVSGLKDRHSELQNKFEQLKITNTKLKESIDALIPEAKRTEEQQKIIKDIEKTYVELDSICKTIRQEKEQLDSQSKSYESEIKKLSKKLDNSISRDKYDNLAAEKKRLELNNEKFEEELKQVVKENDNLQKNYVWLEKEYNALYKNVQDAES